MCSQSYYDSYVSIGTTVLEESYYPLEGERSPGEYCYQLSICDKVIRPYREFLQCFVRIGYEVYAPGSTNPLEFFNSIAKYQRGLCELMSRNGEFVPSRVKDAEMGRKLL